MYTKKEFGQDLVLEINKNFDVIRLARWAFQKFSDRRSKLDKDTIEAMMTVIAMEEGEEFELTKEELLQFAIRLQDS